MGILCKYIIHTRSTVLMVLYYYILIYLGDIVFCFYSSKSHLDPLKDCNELKTRSKKVAGSILTSVLVLLLVRWLHSQKSQDFRSMVRGLVLVKGFIYLLVSQISMLK